MGNLCLEVKKATSFEEQIKRIREYGFIVSDLSSCLDFLQHANYYRLSAYFAPFQKSNKQVDPMPFERIIAIYEFDSLLRTWLYEQIEEIEFYLRTQLAYYTAHEYTPLAYLDEKMFSDRHDHGTFLSKIENCIYKNRRTLVVRHHKQRYASQFPIWVIIEFFSTSMLSFFYADLKRIDKKSLAKNSFQTGDRQLESWLRAFSELRNKCAHYTRFYYWTFTSIPRNSTEIPYTMDATLFSQLLILKALSQNKRKWAISFEKLRELLDQYDTTIELNHIGFPPNWGELLC